MRALIVSSDCFEDNELSEPLQQLQATGMEVDIAAPQQGPIMGKHRRRVSASVALSAVRAVDHDLLLLRGGEAPASLRKIPEAVAIARQFFQADKPVAAICHGPQLLIATGSWRDAPPPAIARLGQELEAAGVNYLDREVVVGGNLVTSRQPADIPAFTRAIFRIMGLSR
jgi:protease I